MHPLTLTLALALCACSADPSFDERFSELENAIEMRARELERQVNRADAEDANASSRATGE